MVEKTSLTGVVTMHAWQPQPAASWQKRNEWILKQRRGWKCTINTHRHLATVRWPASQRPRPAEVSIMQFHTVTYCAVCPSVMLLNLMRLDIRSDLLCTWFIKVVLNWNCFFVCFFCKTPVVNLKHVRMDVEISLDFSKIFQYFKIW